MCDCACMRECLYVFVNTKRKGLMFFFIFSFLFFYFVSFSLLLFVCVSVSRYVRVFVCRRVTVENP